MRNWSKAPSLERRGSGRGEPAKLFKPSKTNDTARAVRDREA
jgi:hypothetical protein